MHEETPMSGWKIEGNFKEIRFIRDDAPLICIVISLYNQLIKHEMILKPIHVFLYKKLVESKVYDSCAISPNYREYSTR